MLVVPARGAFSGTVSVAQIAAYRQLLCDVAVLVTVDRRDLVEQVLDDFAGENPGLTVSEESAQLSTYLYPLKGKSALNVVVRYAMPTAALVISIIAVGISAFSR